MIELNRFYIDGSWVNPVESRVVPIENPATAGTIGELHLGSGADVDKAMAAARRAFDGYSRTGRAERVELLDAMLAEYKRRYAEIAEAITAEMGAPATLASQSQAACGTGHIATTRKALKSYVFEHDIGSTRIVREPVGVCGLITPWNWPINQVACKVVPALAAGCTMVLKPSELAPISAHLFAEVLDEAGVPAGAFNLVHGDGPTVGAAIAAHPEADMVSFTGSTRAGSLVAKAAADSIKRVSQELGGKSPNLILDDADLARAVRHGVFLCFENTGQSCNAPTRMLVPDALYDEAVNLAVATAAKVRVGDPRLEATTMGPLVGEAQWNKVQALIHAGIDEGARLVAGGPGRPEGIERGWFVRPTIFADVVPGMTIEREEIFGPVLSILRYSDLDQAIAVANDTPYGLSAYVTSGDLSRARQVATRLRAGMVHLNGASTDFNAPFGGYKQSGNGREWGAHGIEEFTELKAVMGFGEE